MSLAIDYCKEMQNELQQTAVYLPGTGVSVGDVIEFHEGTIFGPRPLGSFTKQFNLADKGWGLDLSTEVGNNTSSYVFASKNSVNVSFNADATVGAEGSGILSVNFSKQGATYFSAIDCNQTRFKNIIGFSSVLQNHIDEINWRTLYIVIEVTVAAKAIIMQSNTDSSSLEIKGQVKGLQPITGSPISKDASVNANMDLQIKSYKEASFLKDWSNNVPVFFQLVRFHKKFLGTWGSDSTRNLEFMGRNDKEYELSLIDSAHTA